MAPANSAIVNVSHGSRAANVSSDAYCPSLLAQCRIVARGVEEGRFECLHQGTVQAGGTTEALPARRFGFGALPVERAKQVLRRPIKVDAEQCDDMGRQRDAAMPELVDPGIRIKLGERWA